LVSLIKNKASNTTYHLLGLIIAFTIGISTLRGDVMDYIDWKFRLAERTKIVERIKSGSFKPEDDYNKNIVIKKQDNGIVSIEFIIDGGFIDHYSALLYTNDKKEINALNNAIQKDHIFKKFGDNWYRVGY
jgi:hypothetical protein